jgi:hypothetical protein
MVEGSCHCGAVRFTVAEPPDEVTDCNCSICRRYGALWAYYLGSSVTLAERDTTDFYCWGEGRNEFHRCRTCGCATYWVLADGSNARVGVNARLFEPPVLEGVRVCHLDGADTWAETYD